MSEFFKALEQAERDRLRQAQAEAATVPPAARTAVREKITVSEPLAAKPAVVEPIEVKKAGAEPTATKKSVAEPAAPKPVGAQPDVPTRPAPKRAPLFQASPANVFRPALKSREHSGVLRRARRSLLIAQTDPNSLEADAYRTVRTNIELMSDEHPYRHISITSAAGGDGKSTTAANLAVVAAQAGRRVCLVDADLRRPILHEVFGLPNIEGLATALAHGTPLHVVAQPADIENLSVVVAGRGAEETFHDLLTAQRLDTVLRASEGSFDLVIFDSPPVVVADALGVAAVCDGVILVVRAGSIPFTVLRRAMGQIKQVKGRVLGVLLNQADLRISDAGSYQYYHAHDSMHSKS